MHYIIADKYINLIHKHCNVISVHCEFNVLSIWKTLKFNLLYLSEKKSDREKSKQILKININKIDANADKKIATNFINCRKWQKTAFFAHLD